MKNRAFFAFFFVTPETGKKMLRKSVYKTAQICYNGTKGSAFNKKGSEQEDNKNENMCQYIQLR